tara:strand:- start:2177 stop:4675 length:2499 start_codon:yes stop_codon:yes gene_type:complete
MKLKKFNSLKELEKEIESYYEFAKRDYKEVDFPIHLLKEKELEEAGELPSSNRTSSAKEKFTSHKNYKDLVNELNFPKGPDAIKNKVDTWYKDTLYGLVNPKNNLIYHNYWIFVNIAEDPKNPICVFDFVADAFDQMKEIFESKRPVQSSALLKTLQAKRGNSSTISIEKKYNDYIDKRYEDFVAKAARTNSRSSKTQGYFTKESKVLSSIKNFDDFKSEIIKYFKKTKKITTFNGFFDTANTDIYDSYLAFDIFDDGDNPTDEKRLEFLKDPNYFIYEYAARQAGFFVDQNKPWRLVADMSSKPIAGAMRRRLEVSKILFLNKQKVMKAVGAGKQIIADDINRFYENPQIIFSPIYFRDFISDIKAVLEFADYFRNELKISNNTIKNFKDSFITIMENKKPEDVFLEQVFFEKSSAADATSEEFDKLRIFAIKFIDILASLASNEFLVDFIYLSLENEIKVLQPIEKNFDTLTQNDLYNSVFSPIHEYAFFTYLPRKLEIYYQRFLESYPSYTTFEKTSRGLTKAIKNPRQPLLPFTTRESAGLTNDFYRLDFLIDYVELRLLEENKQVSLEEKKFLIDEVKELYQESLSRHRAKQELSLEIRNIATKIIEGYVGSPYNKVKPADLKKQAKKSGMYAHQALFDQSALEPRILLERICLTLPDRADILIEDEVCGKFDFAATVNESPPEEEIEEVKPEEPEPTLSSEAEDENLKEKIDKEFKKMMELANIIGTSDYTKDPPGWYRVRTYIEEELPKKFSIDIKAEICKESGLGGKYQIKLLQLAAAMAASYGKLVGPAQAGDAITFLGFMLGDANIKTGYFECKCGQGKLNC